MCQREGVGSLQHGMHYRIGRNHSVLLMSLRKGAPYADQIIDDGKVLVYEGHDATRTAGRPDPKNVDQPLATDLGTLTPNGKFFLAVEAFKKVDRPTEVVRVYEKILPGVWVYNGTFSLVDAWMQQENRAVLKLRLELLTSFESPADESVEDLAHARLIPTSVKLEVWKRDKGQCQKCGSKDNLHFDHIIPFSRGGSSITPQNIQLLCARHNIQKLARIE